MCSRLRREIRFLGIRACVAGRQHVVVDPQGRRGAELSVAGRQHAVLTLRGGPYS